MPWNWKIWCTSNLKQLPGSVVPPELQEVIFNTCSRNSMASCCFLVENSAWPRPTKVRNMRGEMPGCRSSTSLLSSTVLGASEYLGYQKQDKCSFPWVFLSLQYDRASFLCTMQVTIIDINEEGKRWCSGVYYLSKTSKYMQLKISNAGRIPTYLPDRRPCDSLHICMLKSSEGLVPW